MSDSVGSLRWSSPREPAALQAGSVDACPKEAHLDGPPRGRHAVVVVGARVVGATVVNATVGVGADVVAGTVGATVFAVTTGATLVAGAEVGAAVGGLVGAAVVTRTGAAVGDLGTRALRSTVAGTRSLSTACSTPLATLTSGPVMVASLILIVPFRSCTFAEDPSTVG